jgi:hypothetical protein
MYKITCAVKTPNGSAAIIINQETKEKLMTVYGRIIASPGVFGCIKNFGIVMLSPNNTLHIFTKTNVVITKLHEIYENKIPKIVDDNFIFTFEDEKEIIYNIRDIYKKRTSE